MSLNIILHAIKMVFFNLGASARIGLPLLALMAAQPFVMAAALGITPMEALLYEPQIDPATGLMDWTGFGIFVGTTLLVGLGAVWTIVGWHRYVLLDEMPNGVVPSVPVGRVLGYVWALIVLVFVLALPVFAIMIGLGAVAGMTGAGDGLDAVAIVVVVVLVVLAYLTGFRMSLVLPAAAIGKPMGALAAYRATEGQLGLFIGLILWAILFGLVVVLVIGGVTFAMVSAVDDLAWALPVALGAYAVLQVAATLIGASVLTTLYGVIIEKRDLQV